MKKIQAKRQQETQENPFMQNLTSLEAMKIMKKGPVAITMAKMAINVGMDTDINTGLLFERVAQTVAFATDDRKEGTAAFLEKRDAHFTGR